MTLAVLLSFQSDYKMPHGEVTPLSTACNRELSLMVYMALTEIEERVQNPVSEMRNVAGACKEVNMCYDALGRDFFKLLPGPTLSDVIKHVLDLYVDSVIFFNHLFAGRKEKTKLVSINSIVIGGSGLNEAFPRFVGHHEFTEALDKVRLTTGKSMARFEGSRLERIWQRTDRLPSLSTVMRALLNFNHGLVALDFKPLQLLGTPIGKIVGGHTVTTTSDVSHIFLKILKSRLPFIGPHLIQFNLCGVKADIPCCDDQLLKEISKHCPNLRHLNISHNKSMLSADSFVALAPRQSARDEGPGCPNLETLEIYDNGFKDKDVALVVGYLPALSNLGYKESGKVVKHLFNAGASLPRLTHLNNLGTRARKLIPQGLRFKRTLIEKAINVCPNVHNLKVRVTDADVRSLTEMKNIRSIELLFQAGSITSPAAGK